MLDIVAPVLTPDLAPFYSAITPTAFKGDPLGLSPKHRASVTATYTLPLDDSIGKISLGGTWVHTAKQVVSRATAIQFQTIRANDLINLNASWTGIMGSPVDLAFFMTNVTNEAVPLNVNNAWNSFGMESQIVNQPRMWGVRMRYSFGQ